MLTSGLFASELLEDTYQLLGMAEIGLAPRWFSHRQSSSGTPTRAIAFQLIIIAALIGLDFDSIMCVIASVVTRGW
jgi:amino acid transporter